MASEIDPWTQNHTKQYTIMYTTSGSSETSSDMGWCKKSKIVVELNPGIKQFYIFEGKKKVKIVFDRFYVQK